MSIDKKIHKTGKMVTKLRKELGQKMKESWERYMHNGNKRKQKAVFFFVFLPSAGVLKADTEAIRDPVIVCQPTAADRPCSDNLTKVVNHWGGARFNSFHFCLDCVISGGMLL